MNRLVRHAQLFFALLFVVATCASARAQEAPPDLATAYAGAMAEFQAGNYVKAAADLEALVARVDVTPQVEPIFYTIGSAYFNAGDYPKAIAAFKNYQAKFPKGAHAGGAAFAIAQSNLLSKNYKEAAAQMAALESDPALREQALLFQAEALKAAGNIDGAIAALVKLTGQEIRNADAMRGATMLAQLYAQKGDGAKALKALELIHQKIALADNIIELNALTVELGDKFFNKQQFKEALACYRYAYPREQIIRLQNDRIAGMQRRIEANMAAVRANPSEITQLAAANNQIKENIANAQKLLADFEKLPSITPAIYLRLGRCFYELDRKWEAVVVNQEILDRFKEGPGTRAGALRLDCRPGRRQPARARAGALRAIPARFQKRAERRDRRLFVRRGRFAGGRSESGGDFFRPHPRVATEEPVPRADSLPPGEREICRRQLRRRDRGL